MKAQRLGHQFRQLVSAPGFVLRQFRDRPLIPAINVVPLPCANLVQGQTNHGGLQREHSLFLLSWVVLGIALLTQAPASLPLWPANGLSQKANFWVGIQAIIAWHLLLCDHQNQTHKPTNSHNPDRGSGSIFERPNLDSILKIISRRTVLRMSLFVCRS